MLINELLGTNQFPSYLGHLIQVVLQVKFEQIVCGIMLGRECIFFCHGNSPSSTSSCDDQVLGVNPVNEQPIAPLGAGKASGALN